MKVIKSIAIILVALVILLSLDLIPASTVTSTDTTDIIDEVVFPHDEVVDVNIEIDEDTYIGMLADATSETYVMADITYNGYTYTNIAIRPKGNSSLRDVFQANGDRYSFKIDFNYYIDGQSLLGITKLNLNNIFSDPTMMAEYLGYEMLDSIDATASRTTFVALSINGEYFGLYLSVEAVNDTFLEDTFDDSDGVLYKPDMGVGSSLEYISDNGLDYTGLFPENYDSYNNEEILALIKAIDSGESLDDIFNVDSFLKYLAMSTMTIHLDSYQGSMFHNYYLYDYDGTFEWITWDLNMLFNGYPGSNLSDEEAVSFLIDEPVSSSMSSYPLIEAIFNNESYVEKYHEYLEQLSTEYLDSDTFSEKILSVYNMIKDYVKTDTSSFYSYEEFENALFNDTDSAISLLTFMDSRVENVALQLSGDIESTNSGNGNVGTSAGNNTMGQKPDMINNQTNGVTDLNVPATVTTDGTTTADTTTATNTQTTTTEAFANQRPPMPDGQLASAGALTGQLPPMLDDQTTSASALTGQLPPMLDDQSSQGNMGMSAGDTESVNQVQSTTTDPTDIFTGQNIILSSSVLILMIGAILFLHKKR